MKISLVVATGQNLEIGFSNQLLWHIKEDLQNFKRITTGHHIVMGRKTFESIGRPLPLRTNIIMTSRPLADLAENCFQVDSAHGAIDLAKSRGENELMVIGGGQIYKIFLPWADRIYWTRVDWQGQADTFFPDIDESKWEITSKKRFEKPDLSFEFLILGRCPIKDS